VQQVPGGLAQDGEVGALVQTLLQLVALAVKQLAVGDGAGPRGDVLDLQRLHTVAGAPSMSRLKLEYSCHCSNHLHVWIETS